MTTRLEMVVPSGRELGGRYLVVEPIGTPGGEGAVYRAWDTRARGHVAVKVMHPGLYGLFREAFDAQLELIAGLDHPRFIDVHDHLTIPAADGWPETAALVMRLADRSLADLIGPGGAPRAEALAAGLATAEGLAHLHAVGGTHNDVKPQNLLQVHDDEGPRWVIGDLGVAKLFDGTHTFQPSMDLRYAAPERLRWGHVRRPGDVFSLGMTLHEALCGELPGGYGEYVVSPRLDPPAARLVATCLRADPATRPTMEEVVGELATLAAAPLADPAAVPPRRSVTLPPAGSPAPGPAGPTPGAAATRPITAAEPPTAPLPPAAPVRRPAPRPASPLPPPPPAVAPRAPRSDRRRTRRERRARRPRRGPVRSLVHLVGVLVRLAMLLVLLALVAVVSQGSIVTPDRVRGVVERSVGEAVEQVGGRLGQP